jgi:hypothetical protein
MARRALVVVSRRAGRRGISEVYQCPDEFLGRTDALVLATVDAH